MNEAQILELLREKLKINIVIGESGSLYDSRQMRVVVELLLKTGVDTEEIISESSDLITFERE